MRPEHGRIIDHVEPESRPVPAWIVGVIAAIQSVAWSWGLLVVPAVAAFVAAAAQVTTHDSWRSAVGVASRIWLLAHGGTVSVSDVTISLMPWGLSFIAVLCCINSTRRASTRSVTTWATFVGTYTAIALIFALILSSDVSRTIVVTAVIAMLAGGIGLATGEGGPQFRSEVTQLAGRLPRWCRPNAEVRSGLAGAAVSMLSIVGFAAILVMVWGIAGRATSSDILVSLAPDTVGGIVLGLAQSGYVLTLVAWAVAWLSGAGFQLGAGSSFAPGAASVDPMPTIPMVSALPTGDMAGAWTLWLPLVLVVAGLLGGVVTWRRWKRHESGEFLRVRQAAVMVATAMATIAVVTVVMMLVTSGSAGPGRLETAGASWLGAGLRTSALSAIGTVVIVAWHTAVVRSAVGRWFHAATGWLRVTHDD